MSPGTNETVWSAMTLSNIAGSTMPTAMPSEPTNSLTISPVVGSLREKSGNSWPARASVTVFAATSTTA